MPFWKDLTATRQLLSDAASLTVNKITSDQDIARIHNDAQVWSVNHLASVISGGFNRYLPPADNVQRTPNPAWVFEPGVDTEGAFLGQLATTGGRARVVDVSVYRVYVDVEPLEAMRPRT